MDRSLILLGAVIAIVQFTVRLIRHPLPTYGHPIQAYAFCTVVGALLYGTPLWLIATYIF